MNQTSANIEAFKSALRQARKSRKWTSRKASEEMQIDAGNLSKLENKNSNPRLTTLIRLTRTYPEIRVVVDSLLYNKG